MEWAKQGLLTLTPGNVTDYEYVKAKIRECDNRFDMQEVAYDPWGADTIAQQLQDEDGIVMVAHRQGSQDHADDRCPRDGRESEDRSDEPGPSDLDGEHREARPERQHEESEAAGPMGPTRGRGHGRWLAGV